MFLVNFRKVLKYFLNFNTGESVSTLLIKNGSILRFNDLYWFWSLSLLSQHELFKVLVFGKVCFSLIEPTLFCFIYSFFILLFFISVRLFVFLLLPVSGQLPLKKIAPLLLGLGFALALELGLGLGAIFLGGNCPRTVFASRKWGEFLHANKMFGFIHLLYVPSCTFL